MAETTNTERATEGMADNSATKIFRGVNHASEPQVLVKEYAFTLEGSPRLRIRVWRELAAEPQSYYFELSHHIRTPDSAGIYQPSNPWASSETGALRAAIKALTTQYEEARRAGHEPSEDWFVPTQ